MNEKKLVEFNKTKSMGHRDWGEEILIALSPGNYSLKKLFIKAGKKGGVHQEEAITDCLIIEASTPHCNDRVRVENFYGIEEVKGLQSTNKEDVSFIEE